MKLIITRRIQRIELGPLEAIFSLKIIKIAAKKSLEGLGKTIKSSHKIATTTLKKLNLTGSGGAGRVLFLLQIGTDQSVLVMLRMKNDKQIGLNMAVENPKFKKTLEKNLDSIVGDLNAGEYEAYEL